MKIYICKKCNDDKLKKWFKGGVFKGNRKDVRKHLVEVHFIKGIKILHGNSDKPQSNITANMITKEFKFEEVK